MSRHFCCCIPVRAGVFIFSLLSFLVAGLLSAVFWFVVHEIVIKAPNYTNVQKETEIIIIVLSSLFTLIALASLFGFIGSISRNRRFVEFYSFMSWLVFFASCASAGLSLYTIYTKKNITGDCIDQDSNGNVTLDNCTTHVSTAVKIVATVLVVFLVSIHLYMVVVIRRYVEQLQDDGEAWQGPYKLTTTDVGQGLLNPQGPYPYADPQHSYGNA